MSKRLQVLLEEDEMRELREIAKRERTTVSDWVRRAIRSAGKKVPSSATEKKLAAIRAALQHQTPTADIDHMLDEIEQGYPRDLPT